MQGASTVVVAFVLAAAVPAASSAQQAPGLGLPPLPPVVPTVPAPELQATSVPVPSVPQARVPDVRATGLTAPRVPAVSALRAPSVDIPRSVTGASGPVAPGASGRATGADAPGQEPSGTAARVSAPGLPPGSARRAARASARVRT
jgi:hypothetical protein